MIMNKQFDATSEYITNENTSGLKSNDSKLTRKKKNFLPLMTIETGRRRSEEIMKNSNVCWKRAYSHLFLISISYAR
ncbi:hypothetical protein BK143_11595 [Paenibacillus peoriae]|nr:hypothetical protein BK143_11595 [Paenibacillus peoriae]